jgi:hypothetical protein
MQVNAYKAIVAVVALVCVSVGRIVGEVSQETFASMFTFVLGYVLGNGIAAKNGTDVPGIIRPKPEGRRAEDREEIEHG